MFIAHSGGEKGIGRCPSTVPLLIGSIGVAKTELNREFIALAAEIKWAS
jgi:hypothetical protein